jgi:uncharacterized phage protein (TIGR02220 family)
MLREGILKSPRIAKLGWAEEVFYRRLMSVVDDYGRYHADEGMLRAACYPRLLNKVSDSDIGKWLAVCAGAALVRVYPAQDGERYLQMLDFRQQARATKSKFPEPPSTCAADATQLPCGCDTDAQQVQTNEHLDVVVGVDVVDRKALSGKPDVRAQARELLKFLNDKTGRDFRDTDSTLRPIIGRLREGFDLSTCKAVVVRKWRQWKDDDKMKEYLRPGTLFNAEKFAQYVGEVPMEAIDGL